MNGKLNPLTKMILTQIYTHSVLILIHKNIIQTSKISSG